jgi:prepilin-type processing-associated H-X9-DG protein
VDGYFTISAPYNTATDNNWGARANQWTSASAASDYGNVDARYGGKAVCAFLDGSVKMLSIVELKDMRLWNKNAVTQDLPEYTVTPPVTGGGRPR